MSAVRLPRTGVALAGVIVVAVAIWVLATALGSSTGHTSARVMDGRPAPALSGTTLTGGHYALRPHASAASVVTIWASWCADCRQELPALGSAARRWRAHGVDFATIDTRDGPQAARDVLSETHVHSLPTVTDPRGQQAVAWGATGVPETVVVDRHGIIRGRWLGPLRPSWLDARLRQVVRR